MNTNRRLILFCIATVVIIACGCDTVVPIPPNSPKLTEAEESAFIASLDGSIWLVRPGQDIYVTYRISGRRIIRDTIDSTGVLAAPDRHVDLGVNLTGHRFTVPLSQVRIPGHASYGYHEEDYCDGTGVISDDGKTMWWPTYGPNLQNRIDVYHRIH